MAPLQGRRKVLLRVPTFLTCNWQLATYLAHICPSVLIFARGWISFCDRIIVEERKRSTIERTYGRICGVVRTTGFSPCPENCSYFLRIMLMNSWILLGDMLSTRSSLPVPVIASEN